VTNHIFAQTTHVVLLPQSCHVGKGPGRSQPEADGAKILPTSDQVGLHLASIHQWRHLSTHPINRPATHLSTPKGWKVELAYSWLTCSGRFTHIVVIRRLQADRKTGSVRRPKTKAGWYFSVFTRKWNTCMYLRVMSTHSADDTALSVVIVIGFLVVPQLNAPRQVQRSARRREQVLTDCVERRLGVQLGLTVLPHTTLGPRLCHRC